MSGPVETGAPPEGEPEELIVEIGKYGFVDAPATVSTGAIDAGLALAFLNKTTRRAGVLHLPGLDATPRFIDDFLVLAYLSSAPGDLIAIWMGGGAVLDAGSADRAMADRAWFERRLRSQFPRAEFSTGWIDRPDTLAEVLVVTEPPAIHSKQWTFHD